MWQVWEVRSVGVASVGSEENGVGCVESKCVVSVESEECGCGMCGE